MQHFLYKMMYQYKMECAPLHITILNVVIQDLIDRSQHTFDNNVKSIQEM